MGFTGSTDFEGFGARISADTSSAVSGTAVASGSYSSGDFTTAVVRVGRTSCIQ